MKNKKIEKKPLIHLLCNAHLDPVWLWNWREGLNEGISTTRTMLDFMDEFPDFTFMRGEAAIYDHIEHHDPETFERIRQFIAAGRWDVVGGNWIQPDDNLPATVSALKQLEIGKRYFMEKFSLDVKAGWIADAFGHSRGLPEIYAASGLRYFAFCRPANNLLPLSNTVFYWRGQGGSELLCYRSPSASYGSDRQCPDPKYDQGNFTPTGVLDRLLQQIPDFKLRNLAMFYGLGNHGGGTTRRHLDSLREWITRHPEVEVKFSTLHGFFAALEMELAEHRTEDIPVFNGDLNFCMRGCYASDMRLKKEFRRAEAVTARSSRIQAALGDFKTPADMSKEWKGICFNSFHDILPGTSIESACEEQIQWLGGISHQSRVKEFDALFALSARVDTTVKPVDYDMPSAVPFVFFNPWPREFKGHVELEACLDFRPIWDYTGPRNQMPVELLGPDGQPVAFQVIEPENHCLRGIPPWRYRVVFELSLPPMGWKRISMGYRKDPLTATSPDRNQAHSTGDGVIENGIYRVEVNTGDKYLRITRCGKELLGVPGLSFATFEDQFGSWGDMSDKEENLHLTAMIAQWHISRWKLLESGPERAVLWVEFAGQSSRLTLTVQLYRDTDAVSFQGRLLWMERACRLKMLMGKGTEATYEVPGGRITRGETPFVPGGRWVKVILPEGNGYGFVSDAFYGFENEASNFAVVMCRGTRYCTDIVSNSAEFPERATADNGELKFNFTITAAEADLEQISEDLEQPPVAIMCSPHHGVLPSTGTLLEISNPGIKLCDLQYNNGNLEMLVQNQTDSIQTLVLRTPAMVQNVTDLQPWKIRKITI
jgi:alpha-mannosidase